jgi:preprotein translocase subunit YajC
MNWIESSLALAGQTTTQTAKTGADATKAKPETNFGQMLPLILGIGVLFYFMIIRPQKKDQKKVADMRESMKKGDRVRTIGGMYGAITSINTEDNTITVQVDKATKIEFDRAAIATVIRKDSDKSAVEKAE